MILNLPKVGMVKFNDDLSPDELHTQVKTLSEKYGFELPKLDYGTMGAFTHGVSRGVKRLGSTVGDVLPAFVASGLGFDDYAHQQMQEHAQSEAEIAKYNPAQFNSYKEVNGPLDALKYGAETLGEVSPDIVGMLTPAGAGRVVGGRLAERGLVKGAEKALGAEAAEVGLSDLAKEELLTANAAKIAGAKTTGQNVGLYLGSFAQNAPEVFSNIYDSSGGKLEPGAALIAGSISAIFDSALPAKFINDVSGPLKGKIVENVLTKSGMHPSLAKTAVKSIIVDAGLEGLTEGTQEAISIAAENFVNKKGELFSPENVDRMLESAVKGAVGGGGFGAITSPLEYRHQKGLAEERQNQVDTGVMQQQELFKPNELPPGNPPPPPPAGPEAPTITPPPAPIPGGPAVTVSQPPVQTEMFTEKGALSPEVIGMQKRSTANKADDIINTATTIDNDFIKAVGTGTDGKTKFGNTAKQWEPIKGAPITVDTAVDIKNALLDYKGKDPKVLENINKVLARPEFAGLEPAAPVQLTEQGVNNEGPKRKGIGTSDGVSIGSQPTQDQGVGGNLGPSMGIYSADLGGLGKGEKAGNAALKQAGIFETQDESGQQYLSLGEKQESTPKQIAEKTPEQIKQAKLEREALIKREAALSKKLNEAGKDATDIYASQPEAKENKNLDLSSTIPAKIKSVNEKGEEVLIDNPTLEGSKFQAKFKKDATLGDALKTLKKMPINKGQQALANVLLHTANVPQVKFELAKHPQPKDMGSKKKLKYVGQFTGQDRNLPPNASKKVSRYEKFTGEYDSATNSAKLYQSGNAESLLHEGTHAATAATIDKHVDHVRDEKGVVYAIPKDNSAIGKRWVRMFNAARSAAKEKKLDFYGLQDVHEFVAEAWNNDEFKIFLKNTAPVLKTKGRPKMPSLWTDLVNTVKDMLGIPEKFESLLEEVMSYSPELFKGPDTTIDQAVSNMESIIKGESKYTDAGGGRLTKTKHFSMLQASDRSDAIELLNSSGSLYEKMPEFGGVKNGLFNTLSKYAGSTRSYLLGSMSLENLHELYGKVFPNILTLDKAVKKRNSYHHELKKNIDNLTHKGIELVHKQPQNIINKFNTTVLELSRQNVDPRPEAGNASNPLVVQFNSLPESLRNLAIEYVKTYEDYSNKMLDMIAEASPSKTKELRQLFESNRLPFYVPLTRKGNYWLQYTESNGEIVSIARDNPREINMMKEWLDKNGASNVRVYSKITDVSHKTAPPAGFAADLIKIMKEGGADEAALDKAYQTYLSLFPVESIRQHFRERRGDPGYIKDVIQGFAQTAPKMATQLSNLKHGPDIDKAYSALNDDFQNSTQTKMEADVMAELKKREDFIRNPSAEGWAYWLSNANFVMSIGGNISSALINTTVLPMVVLPKLAVTASGGYNYTRAFNAMMDAKKLFFKGGYDDSKNYLSKNLKIRTFGVNPNLSANLKDLYKQANENGVLAYSIGRDLNDVANTPSDQYTALKSKAGTLLGLVFEGTERFNREVTLIAAYNLAIKDGLQHQAAIDKALTLTSRIHTEAVSEAGPRWLQHGLPKVALTFKRFVLAQILNMGMLARTALKGEDKLTRQIAQKQLLGIMGATWVFAGIKGLPGYGAANVLANFLASDDDEPFDLDEWLDDSVGTVMTNGMVNKITGLDIASRTGFENTLWRDDPKRLADVGYLSFAMEKFLGPSFSTARNFEEGIKQMGVGQVERGFEKLSPAFVRGPLKAWRYMTEGALDKDGAPIIDDVNGWNQMMQIIGFSPAELSAQYARTSAMKKMEQGILHRRNALLDSAYLATVNGDEDAIDHIMDKIDNFNDKNPEPGIAITQDTLNKSFTTRERNIMNSVGGMNFNPKLLPRLEETYSED